MHTFSLNRNGFHISKALVSLALREALHLFLFFAIWTLSGNIHLLGVATPSPFFATVDVLVDLKCKWQKIISLSVYFFVYLFIYLFVKKNIDCSRNVIPSTTQKAVYSSLSL